MKRIISIKEETYNLIRETIAFWRSDERYTVAPIGWQEIADSKPYEERPQGEWTNKHFEHADCSLCGRTNDYHGDFCKHCGAEMKGGKR